MIFFYIVIPITLIVLRLCAWISKPIIPSADNSYSRVFLPQAALVCTWLMRISDLRLKRRGGPGVKSIKDRKLLSNLQTLYPGEPADSLKYRYHTELISIVMLVIGTGACISLAAFLVSSGQGVLTDGNVIYRGPYGGADVEADLFAGINNGEGAEEYPLRVSIPARIYSYDEAEELFDEMSLAADRILLKDNDSPEHVTGPVDFFRSIEGYPFSISWSSDNYELLDCDGAVHNEALENPCVVTVTGDCTYGHDHWYLVRSLQICPRELDRREKIAEEIERAVNEADKQSATQESVSLPDRIKEGEITWSEKADDLSPYLFIAAIAVACIIAPFRESEISSKLKSRSRELLIEYPTFVSQLTLYMGAGMSVRNCLVRFGTKAQKNALQSQTYLEKELIITAHEIEMGISESEAINHFGKRCGTREYMRFSALLNQNMKKGSTDLLATLKEEAEDAFTLRKNEARKLGEEASTKLLLPMVMMLTVVMIVIMVPAYMSFSS